MKIVLVGAAFPHRGGIAHFNSLLYKTLSHRGHSVQIVSFKRLYPAIFFPGKTQYENEGPEIPLPTDPLIDSINPFSWIKAAQNIKEHNPDLAIFQHWLPFFCTCIWTDFQKSLKPA